MCIVLVFFFFKQKTAYEMRISDWSSDVCSSDLLDTPLSVYLKLADGANTYLFESVEGGETWGRYSIIGLPAQRRFEFRGHTLTETVLGEIVDRREVADPLGEVEVLRQRYRVRSEEHTSELQSLMRISYAVFCLTKKQMNDSNHSEQT